MGRSVRGAWHIAAVDKLAPAREPSPNGGDIVAGGAVGRVRNGGKGEAREVRRHSGVARCWRDARMPAATGGGGDSRLVGGGGSLVAVELL